MKKTYYIEMEINEAKDNRWHMDSRQIEVVANNEDHAEIVARKKLGKGWKFKQGGTVCETTHHYKGRGIPASVFDPAKKGE